MNFLSVNKPVSFLFILVFAGIMWSGQYMVRDLWEPDEARYTYVAQEMDQSGSWLVPMRKRGDLCSQTAADVLADKSRHVPDRR